jgi:thermostable 8-oxoguanine DNA glycosylase
MIVPEKITNYNRTEKELEEFLIFAILVAGKTAKTQARKLEQFLASCPYSHYTPFEYLEYMIKTNTLTGEMMRLKLGQYKRLLIAFLGIVRFKGNLKNVTVDDLESIKGIGSKTARFFVLHSRPKVRHAVLDTHILKWMGALGINVPKATPPKKKYKELEEKFLALADERNMSVADLDLHIWKTYAMPDYKG